MTLKRAIKILEQQYDRAKTLEWVRNPLAYALHKVWRIADCEQPKITPNTEAALEKMCEKAHGG